ncbi:ABC transporter permease [Methanoculleus chikugoensis]|uniref:ABC transporter permease n=1 Tax=Methanoculleus chikugoensis TaxID=118126 RepID=UPI001FB1DCE3|nr:ABC transporter permease [Methanoculleus chikugoensis]
MPGGWFERVSCDIGAAWAIARKDMKIYYLKPSILVSSLLFPFVMFLAFAIGRNAPPGTLLPGLLAITLLFSASSIEPVSIPIERRTKTFDRLLAAPVSVQAIVLGSSLSGGAIFASAIGVATTGVGLVAFHAEIIHIVALLVALAFTSLCFSMMGTLFAAYRTENVGEVMSLLNLVRLPLLFISGGVFIPLREHAGMGGQSIALLSPLTYAHDLIQFAFDGTTRFGPGVDTVALVLAIIVFQVAGGSSSTGGHGSRPCRFPG